MARCYSGCVRNRQTPRLPRALPDIWVVSDRRNDGALAHVLARLPRGSGLIFRHYHLAAADRTARFRTLLRLGRARRHVVVWSGSATDGKRAGADGAYGSPPMLARGPALLRLETVHSLRELAAAHRSRADAVLISPVFATASHPGAPVLGPVRFRLIAARAKVPVIALGGMSTRRARSLRVRRWAAIASFAQARSAPFPLRS